MEYPEKKETIKKILASAKETAIQNWRQVYFTEIYHYDGNLYFIAVLKEKILVDDYFSMYMQKLAMRFDANFSLSIKNQKNETKIKIGL